MNIGISADLYALIKYFNEKLPNDKKVVIDNFRGYLELRRKSIVYGKDGRLLCKGSKEDLVNYIRKKLKL